MNQPGEIDPVYVEARRVLLDALEALGAHRDAVVLIGAQAIYLHTGEADLGIGLYTTDGDLAILPADLSPDPLLAEALGSAGFIPDEQHVGTWIGRSDVKVDLLVPEALADGGRRSADLGEHGKRTARRARGIEAAAVDNESVVVAALDASDSRSFALRVAGPAALLVAKLHKLNDRVGTKRLMPKDGLDVLRLLELPSEGLASTLDRLRKDAVAGAVTTEATEILRSLFATPEAEGSGLAAESLAGRRDEAIVRASCSALASELLALLDS